MGDHLRSSSHTISKPLINPSNPLPIMDFSDVFRIVNLAAGVFMVLGGVAQFFPISIQHIVVGIYAILFGLATALLEFQIPPQVARYASFMFSFVGRGVFYIFIGGLCFSGHWTKYIIGGII